ncbi:MAG: DNA-binding transcriptional MerR regulator [Cocleimonas sp.]|jgi:DNA-binding transcriptional MerR regulator
MKIGELSNKSGLSTHTIRYYEKIGLFHKAQKDQSGHRNYHSNDLDLVNWVTCLKKSGMSLKKIREYVDANNNDQNIEVAEILELHLSNLKLQQTDIAHYIEVTKDKLKTFKGA